MSAPLLNHTILFYKPYGVLSQFTREGRWKSLADFGPFPPGVYAAGRLDADSEGMLIITDDNSLRERLTEPRYAHPRTYLVQVERLPDDAAIRRLNDGIVVDGKLTRPARARLLSEEPDLQERPVPIRKRKNVPTAWLEMTLREGRNRQVRKMTAAVGHPTLRLVRIRIGDLTLEGLQPGEWKRLDPAGITLLCGVIEGVSR